MVNFESPSGDNDHHNDYEDEMDVVVIEVLVVGAAVVTVIILIWAAMNCSRKASQVDFDPPSGVTDYKIEHGLITEVFDGTNHLTGPQQKQDTAAKDPDPDVSASSLSSSENNNNNENTALPDEAPPVPLVCALCSKPIQIGDVMCKSYNTECRHIHHKDCMTNHWLHLQNTCPTCNRTFLIEQA